MIYRYFTSAKTYGVVANRATGKAVDLVIVRAKDSKSGKIIRTTVSNSIGRYSLVLPKGNFSIKANKYGLAQFQEQQIMNRSAFTPTKTKINMIEIARDIKTENTNPTLVQPIITVSKVNTLGSKRLFSDSSEIIERFNNRSENNGQVDYSSTAFPNWKFR
jgi:hypothetical protein